MMQIPIFRNRDRVLLVEAGRLHPAIAFSRPSTVATYMDGTGIIRTSPVNLVKQSQALNTSPWANSAVSTTASTATFNGIPYWTVAKTTTGSAANLVYANVASAVNGTVLTVTAAFRAGTSSQVSFGLYGATSTWGGSSGSTVAIVSGVGSVSSRSGNLGLCDITGLSATSDTVVTITRTYTQSEAAHLYFYPDGNLSTTNGASNLITRVQVEATSNYTTYIPTTTNISGAPRFEYSPAGVYLGLLMEEARTNLIKQSQNLTNSWPVTNGASVGSSAATYASIPYWELNRTTTASNAAVYQDSVYSAVSGTVLTLTFACRAGTSTQLSFGLYGSTTSWGGSSGTTVAIVSGPGTLAQVSGNLGLCLVTGLSTTSDTVITMTRTYTATETARMYFYPDGSNSVTVGASNLVTRVQVEAAASYTSYIPTTTATVTRSADNAVITPLSAITYNATEGTFVTQITQGMWATSQQTYFCLNDNTLSNRNQIRRESKTTVTLALITVGGTTQTSYAQTTGNDLTLVKAAVRYKASSSAGSANGLTASTGSPASLPVVDRLHIGHNTGGNLLNGWIKYLAYYPRGRANADLKALST